MDFFRRGILKRKVWFCQQCGYNYSRTWRGIKEDVIYGVYQVDIEDFTFTSIIVNKEAAEELIKNDIKFKILDWKNYGK